MVNGEINLHSVVFLYFNYIVNVVLIKMHYLKKLQKMAELAYTSSTVKNITVMPMSP